MWEKNCCVDEIDIKEFEKISNAREWVAMWLANTLDVLYKWEKEIKQILWFHWLDVEYKIWKEDWDRILFAKFKINKGLMQIKKTFVIDMWHTIAWYEWDESSYIHNEMKKLIRLIK